jgi:cytochrome c
MSDRLNTIFGWLLGAGVVALLLRFLVGFAIPETERPEELGYVVQGVEEEGGAAAPDLGTLLASADVAAGEASFAKCMACHTIAQGGATGIGPNLWGVVGTGIGHHAAGFAYSGDLAGHGGEWTYENLDAWLKSPKAFASGTKMSFPGLGDPQERANVLAYLHANGGGPAFPAPAAPAAEEGAAPADGEAAAEEAGAEGVEAAEVAGVAPAA